LDDCLHPQDIGNQGELTMQDRRNGASPIPSDPELYINEYQVHGLIILKKFGWKLVCIRRCHDLFPSVILNNRIEGRVGVLQHNGVLMLRDDLKIRNQNNNEVDLSDEITKGLLIKFSQYPQAG
jgi:hypothetical protein